MGDELNEATIMEGALLAHDTQYEKARKLLGRGMRVEYIQETDCVFCRLGSLTSEESAIAHRLILWGYVSARVSGDR